MRTIKEIIIHCSATAEGKDYTVDDIDRWHKQRKFDCIGYHYVIYRDGTLHLGRSVERNGAHCTNHNTNSIGICYIGGCAADGKTAKDTRTPEQKKTLAYLVKELKKQYPSAKVIGHRDTSPDKNHDGKITKNEWLKACPSFDVAEWLKEAGL